MQNIFHSRFSRFLCFVFLFLFSSFLSVFLFFLFSFSFSFFFPFFLVFFSLSSSRADAGNGRIREHRVVHARFPASTRIPGVGPATTHDSRSISSSLVRPLHQPIRGRVCRTPEEKKSAPNAVWGPPQTRFSASSLSSRARPSHRPITTVRSLHTRSQAQSHPKPNLKPHEFKC